MSEEVRAYDESHIKTLDGLIHLRKRSSMYGFGAFSVAGIYLMAKEIFDNSVDEVRQDPNNPHRIDVTFCKLEKGFQMIVQDDGRGVPLKRLEASFTVPGTSGKWLDAYVSSGGTNGMGAKGVVSVSNWATAVSRRQEGMGIIGTLGTSIANNEITTKNGSSSTGTIFVFEPDHSHMRNSLTFFEPKNGYDKFIDLVNFISAFVPNTTFNVYFMDTPLDHMKMLKASPKEAWDILTSVKRKLVHSPDKQITLQQYHLRRAGVLHPVIWKSGVIEEQKLLVPITLQGGLEKKDKALLGYRVEFFLTADYNLRSAGVLGAVNTMLIDNRSSSHLKVVIQSIKDSLYQYVDEQYQEFFQKEYALPFHIISIVDWQHAEFHNQEKSDFEDSDFETGFSIFLKRRLEDLDPIFWYDLHNKIADNIRIKWESKKKRDGKLQFDVRNLTFNLNNPKCYFECRSNVPDDIEIFICEGVSSGDYVHKLCDENTQAVFELRGKTKNAFKDETMVIDDNEILGDLKTVLGTDPIDTKLEKLRFGKVGILADADADGYHIVTLAFSALYAINPAILSEGRVFVLSPPLYVVKMTGKDAIFVRNERGLAELQAETYSCAYDVAMVIQGKVQKRHVLKGTAFISMCYAIKYLGELLVDVGAKQNVDPALLELLVYCIDDLKSGDSRAIANKLALSSCDIEKSTNTLVMYLEGFETIVPLNGLVAAIEKQILPEFKKFNIAQMELRVTTKKTKFYEDEALNIMQLVEAFKAIDKLYTIDRCKGLGEMSEQHLYATCLNPETRTYIKITGVGDLANLKALMGIDTKARKGLMSANIER